MTTWNPDIWTGEVRRVLFQLLVKKFGPYSEWENTVYPGRGLDEEYKNFLTSFAQTVGAANWEAVRHQIYFAVETGQNNFRGSPLPTVMCKAAAVEMGFISNADLPELVASPDGVTAVSLDDPAELHSAIDRTVS
jgi:hypothetical protein